MSAEQSAALADDVVTADEYKASYRRFAACLLQAGTTVQELGESYGVINYAVPESAMESGAMDRCYNLEFQQVDMRWQLSNEESSETAHLLQQCLADKNLPPGDTVNERLEILEDAGLTFDDCT